MCNSDSPPKYSVSFPAEFYTDLDQRIKRAVSEALNNTDTPRYLTRKEAAGLLNISLPTLMSYVKKGLLPAQKIGTRVLFDEEKLKECLRDLSGKGF